MDHTKLLRKSISALFAILLLFSSICAYPALSESSTAAYDEAHPENLTAAHLSGQACIAMDYDTGEILFDKNAFQKMYPASTTKIMTCMLALEKGPSLDTIVTIPKEAAKVPADSSLVPITVGEEMTFADLLYGFMMKSGNDAANAIAVIVAGTISDFVDMMNARAEEIGCLNTHFANPHGYQDASHYTTAYDLALITREALQYDAFRSIVSSVEYTMAPTSVRDKLTLSTENNMFVATSSYYYDKLIGVKTGYTSSAGRCFVGAAVNGSATVISVTLKSTKAGRWTDTKKLMEYAFTKYNTYTFDDLYSLEPVKVFIENSADNDEDNGFLQLSIVPGSTISSYTVDALPSSIDFVRQDFRDSLSITYSRDLVAPVVEGDVFGTLSLVSDGETLTGLLIADRNIAEQPESFSLTNLFPGLANVDFTLVIFIVLLVLLILLIIFILTTRARIRRNRRRKRMLQRRRKAYEQYRRQAAQRNRR